MLAKERIMIRIRLKAALPVAALLCSALLHAVAINPPATVLSAVKSTGTLQCGVIREAEDYSKAEVHGNRAAFDIDVCKAIAVAILGDRQKVLFLTYPDEPKAMEALIAGKIQVVASATPSFANTTERGVAFSPVTLVDGQGFMVNKQFHIASFADLADKKVCFVSGTSNGENLALFAAREKVNLIPFPFEEQGEMEAAMYTANCAAMTTDVTQLANTRARYRDHAKDFDILPQLIAIDPLAVAYARGDLEWASVVNAIMSALLQAEESGLTAANIDQRRSEAIDPAVRFYFAKDSGVPRLLHLDPDWAVRAVRAVGNYGELYDRDLGSKTPLQLARGLNNLWNRGGLLAPQPISTR
jgi:general L-amino acid transport system substrate-binding protein